MSDKVRVPLPTDLATRDATLTHDGQLKNFYEEETPIGPMVIKRPGMTNNIALGACVAQGSTFFNGVPVFICSNTAYFNNPTVGLSCPTSVTSFGLGNNVAIDTSTGFVWTSDGTNNLVHVYNPVTQTQVTTIAPPTGAKANDGGITLVPNSRNMMVASDDIFLTYNLWTINADTYAVGSKIISSGNNTYISPIYVNGTSFGILFDGLSHNGTTFHTDSFTAPNTPGTYSPTTYAGGGYKIHPFLPVFALSGGQGVTIVDASSTSAPVYYDYGLDNFTTTAPGITFDISRNRLWFLDYTNNKLKYAQFTGTTPSAAVTLTTIPTSDTIPIICYDKYRDVIWMTSSSGTLRAISPATGNILLSCPGGCNPANHGQNKGTNLLLINQNAMIQCAATAAPSLTYIALG